MQNLIAIARFKAASETFNNSQDRTELIESECLYRLTSFNKLALGTINYAIHNYNKKCSGVASNYPAEYLSCTKQGETIVNTNKTCDEFFNSDKKSCIDKLGSISGTEFTICDMPDEFMQCEAGGVKKVVSSLFKLAKDNGDEENIKRLTASLEFCAETADITCNQPTSREYSSLLNNTKRKIQTHSKPYLEQDKKYKSLIPDAKNRAKDWNQQQQKNSTFAKSSKDKFKFAFF